jgi:RNA polymerase sigma-70 factor (ECF subfamily)
MHAAASMNPEQTLELARRGDAEALGRLLETYRNYLAILARVEIDRRLQSKVDASDVVQDAFLHATRAFPQFHGTGEGEILRWLRQILRHRLVDMIRQFYGTHSRDIRLERQLDEDLDRSSCVVRALFDSKTSPSRQVARREQAVLVADALARLPDDHRDVIVLHEFEGLSLAEVARRMGRSESSVERLWVRSLVGLRGLLGEKGDELT